MADVSGWPFERKLEVVFQRTLPRLASEVGRQLAAIITPASRAIIAGVLVAWVVSHAFGIGEAIDLILAVVGVLAIGMAVFAGLDHLYQFAARTYQARTETDLDAAAVHLASAIGILGIQAVLAVLFRGRATGGRVRVGPPPPRTPGSRYRPSITQDAGAATGSGSTSFWGNIRVSTQGTATDRALVLLHEKVHQFLAPKLYLLRDFRVANRGSSYFGSSLWRFIEEALAETIAQVGVVGFRQFFTGIRFPVQNGYVFLTRGGGYGAAMQGRGVLPESAALLARGTAAGMAFDLYFQNGVPSRSDATQPEAYR